MKPLLWTTAALLCAVGGAWLLREGLAREIERRGARYTRRHR